ncbi:MAG: VOC family protein [Comamonas sp.]|uniref:VOC family protein n=1 Tax=Comamonas sp. TaxID=34028 RepID=UPI002FCB0DBE
MSVIATAHLNFQGQARQALNFYQSVFGGQAMLVTYQQAASARHPADAHHIAYGQVESDNGFRIMAYDVAVGTPWQPGVNAYFVSLRGETAAEIADLWNQLSAGATIVHALAPAHWSPLYGMLKDRFGVVWVLDVRVAYAAA